MIEDLFFYFAQFPQRDGVLSMFTRGASDHVTGYQALIDKVNAMPDHSTIPDIGSYIFGASEKAVIARIDAVSGTYLFVDYGEIESEPNKIGSMKDDFQCGITVATKCSDTDLGEQLIFSQRNLCILDQIRRRMYTDCQKIPWLKTITLSHRREPFSSPGFQSTGWSMLFTISGYDLSHVKE